MSTPPVNPTNPRLYRRYWVYILMLTLVMINYIDRSALSIVAKSIATEFNLSPVQMRDRKFVDLMSAVLAETAIAPSRVGPCPSGSTFPLREW